MLQAKTNATLTMLNEEMDAIHLANGLYWKRGQQNTLAARSQYKSRQDRLEKIREELAMFRGELAIR